MNENRITHLEKQWAVFKYEVLEKDPATYQKIRTLLKNKTDPDESMFLELIQHAKQQPIHKGHQQTALEHVWGYFKRICTPQEKTKFENELRLWLNNDIELIEIKQSLYSLALKYQVTYLLESSYFDQVKF
ncbi:MAG: UV DNA damage endonuclease [Erysipelotrichaceae bacterium]|nr:MAG: UV DNA damage [Erysipelotrichaceae bacterium]TXT19949.1 MAG: UV DNA damage endonuclease [Erysipelotrichaceae bacterium]